MKIEIRNDWIKINCDLSIHNNGTKFSFNKNQYHRIDSPACEFGSGNESWWLECDLHRKYGPARKWRSGDRVDGPAYEWNNGDEDWRLEGKVHRKYGPAVERSNGNENWFLSGICYRICNSGGHNTDIKDWYRGVKLDDSKD